MSSSVSSSELFQPLREDKREIRLLQLLPSSEPDEPIACSFRTVELDNAPPYRALSYVWGDASITEVIVVNDMPYPVTANLFVALNNLRTFCFRTPIWIDGICINQKDNREKSHQIPLMKEIYSRAAEVIMWLGEEADDSSAALALIERWSAGAARVIGDGSNLSNIHWADEMISYIENPFEEKGWIALDTFFLRPYWKRQWVVQEVICAYTARIICGRDRISFQSFKRFMIVFVAIISLLDRDHPAITPDNRWKVMNCKPPLVFDELKKDSSDLLEVVNAVRGFLVTDPRDKIFSVLGICKPEERLVQPDYSLPVERVFVDTTVSHITRKDNLQSIALAGIGFRSPPAVDELHIPSWVPDFRQSHGPWIDWEYFNSTPSHFPAYKIDSKFGVLKAVGILCDHVAAIKRTSDADEFDDHTLIKIIILPEYLAFMCKRYVQNHPTGLPWTQVFFRTIIHDTCLGNRPGFRGENLEALFFRRAAGFMEFLGDVARGLIGWDFMSLSSDSDIYDSEDFISSSSNGDIEDEKETDSGIVESSTSLRHKASEIKYGNIEQNLGGETIEDYVKSFLFWCVSQNSYPHSPTREGILELFCGSRDHQNSLRWPDHSLSASEKSYFMHFINSVRIFPNMVFFITMKGYIGTAPMETKDGDMICLVFGCPVPLIVRPQEDYHIIVGWAYIYGMMNGEMMDELREGRLHTEEFTFH
jgi:hypothetical protein